MDFFCLLSIQYATMLMTTAAATAASMAISVVINGASVASAGSGSVGIDCCDVMDADGAVSPDINLASPKQ